MDDADDLWRQLLIIFEAELAERAVALAGGLLALEEADSAATAARAFDTLYHAAYNLQGAARVVELADVAHLAGTLAAAFAGARRPEQALAEAWFAAARRAVAFLPRLAEAERAGSQPPELFDVLADLASPVRDIPAPALSTAVVDVSRAAAPAAGRVSDVVRVKVSKLDALLAQSGELAVTRIRVEQRLAELTEMRDALGSWRREWRASRRQRAALRRHLANLASEPGLVREFESLLRQAERGEARALAFGQQIAALTARLRQDVAQLGLVGQELTDEVMAVRLLPVATAFGPFERLVRDLAHEQGKVIDLVLIGGDTEIDRKILERLSDPLIHMLRNAVDHGIESTEVRAAAGKATTGQIRLAVANLGGAIEIALTDDGAGLDPAQLRALALRKGLLRAEEATVLDEQGALALIFQPGFSTTAVVTTTSGRGVGMDVVRDEVARLNGHIHTASISGQGTTFTITVPLTLATTRAILVEQAGQRFVIPSASIERTARVRAAALVALEGRRAVVVEGHPVPVIELADLLSLPTAVWPSDPRAWRSYIVLRQDERRVALLIDRLLGEQEIVIKPLGWPLRRVRNVSGAVVLGSGETVAILNPADLLIGGLRIARTGAGVAIRPAVVRRGTVPPAKRRRVLVVDDSLTTRMLERGILESAGYEAIVVADGAEALDLLGREVVDLVISDVEMPVLDGFGLTAAIRRDERLRHLPVVLVTSLDTPEHRERGLTAGADAYLGKGSFDQGQLLDTIGRLL